MGLQINRMAPMLSGLLADRRLFLTADKSRIVEEDAPDAAFLFATPGTPITAEDVGRYGLAMVDGELRIGVSPDEQKIEPASEPDAVDPPPRAPSSRRK